MYKAFQLSKNTIHKKIAECKEAALRTFQKVIFFYYETKVYLLNKICKTEKSRGFLSHL